MRPKPGGRLFEPTAVGQPGQRIVPRLHADLGDAHPVAQVEQIAAPRLAIALKRRMQRHQHAKRNRNQSADLRRLAPCCGARVTIASSARQKRGRPERGARTQRQAGVAENRDDREKRQIVGRPLGGAGEIGRRRPARDQASEWRRPIRSRCNGVTALPAKAAISSSAGVTTPKCSAAENPNASGVSDDSAMSWTQ